MNEREREREFRRADGRRADDDHRIVFKIRYIATKRIKHFATATRHIFSSCSPNNNNKNNNLLRVRSSRFYVLQISPTESS